MTGAIIIDKPQGWTSHDAVNKVRRLVGTRRVGHLGTLDPLATGVLPALIGKATRLSQFYSGGEKIYDATIRFGITTNTYDRQGTPVGEARTVDINLEALETALDAFRGEFLQTPPPVSAKKVQGVAAYKLARRNVEVDLAAVPVTVHAIDVLDAAGDRARLRIRCTAGTYVRSIAHDVGRALGCGAILDELRREASSGFTLEHARTIPVLEELASAGRIEEALLPSASLLPGIPSEYVDEDAQTRIRHGQDFRVSPFRIAKGERHVRAISTDGELIAIGEIRLPNVYHPIVVL